MKNKLKVLSIGYGRNLFDREDAERGRMVSCSKTILEHHMIIFTLRTENFHNQQVGGLYLYPTNSRTKFGMLFDAFFLGISILKKQNRDWVITAQDPFETSLIALCLSRKFHIPFNIQEHGDFYSTNFWKKDKLSNFIRFYIGIFMLKKATTVRVVSKRIQNALLSIGILKEKIFVLPVRSDHCIVKHRGLSVSESLKQSHQASPVILGMGRFVSQKNFELLIAAFSGLLAKESRAILVIVGQGAEESTLRSQVKILGIESSVVFLPWTDDPLGLIEAADIFALSSNWEGWARVLVEAMSVGTPIVTTDVGCAGEVILDRRHGYVVPVGDLVEFREKLISLVKDHEKRFEFKSNLLQDYKNISSTSEEYADRWSDILLSTYFFIS